jgi:transposase
VVDGRSSEDQSAAISISRKIDLARSKNGQAISATRRTPSELKLLAEFIAAADRAGDLDAWRRGKAVNSYLAGETVISLAEQLDVTRGSINRWLQWFERKGTEGLRSRKAPGAAPRLSQAQKNELAGLIEAGPQSAGFSSGMWTGPLIGELIRKRFGIRYHNHHVPRLLNKMGFSVQRPRKRLARADAERQALWLKVQLPAIKKKPRLAVAS